MKVMILSLIMAFCLVACAAPTVKSPTLVHQFETGHPIDAAKVNQIIEGKTTEQEANSLLGTPQTVQQRPDGTRILIFTHYQSQMGGPSAANLQGGISHEMLFLGVRNGIVMKKAQKSSYQPTSSFTGWTN